MGEQDCDSLMDLRQSLVEDFNTHWDPKVESARRRRRGMVRAVYQLSVQSLATVIGGGVLGGLAVLTGIIQSDATLRAGAFAFVIGAVICLVVVIWTAAHPLDTAEDGERLAKIQQIDEVMAELKKRAPSESSAESFADPAKPTDEPRSAAELDEPAVPPASEGR